MGFASQNKSSIAQNWQVETVIDKSMIILPHTLLTVTSMPKRLNNQIYPPIFQDSDTNNPGGLPATTNNRNYGNSTVFLNPSYGGGGRSLFPRKLRKLLDDAARQGNESIVSWFPHGRSFRVHKPKEFAEKIVGKYFNHGQYRSFTRQVGKKRSGRTHVLKSRPLSETFPLYSLILALPLWV